MKRFPFIKQKDSMQCGVACLTSICEYYGKKYSTQFISKLCSCTPTGISLQSLKLAAEQLGFDSMCVRIPKDSITGNVKSNSILEIWNSKEAKSLYEIKQEDFPEDSLCHSCGKFKECRTFRQVCYRDIIRKYGSQKWYYPDVKCPYNKNKIND